MRMCLCQPVLNAYNPEIRAFFEVLTHGLSVFAKIAAIKYDVDVEEITYTAATPCNLQALLSDVDIFVFAGHSDTW